jgi:hypothetical protein
MLDNITLPSCYCLFVLGIEHFVLEFLTQNVLTVAGLPLKLGVTFERKIQRRIFALAALPILFFSGWAFRVSKQNGHDRFV